LTLAVAAPGAGAQGGDGRPEQPLTTLEVRVLAPPHVVKGTDGRQHIEYDLAITNVFTSDVTLTSLEVRDQKGRSLLRLEGDALAAVTTEFLGVTPTPTLEPSQAVQTVVDVTLPRGAQVPARLTHRLRYEFPPDALFHQLIGSRQVDGPCCEYRDASRSWYRRRCRAQAGSPRMPAASPHRTARSCSPPTAAS
jgi:hypothetical protein